MKKGFVFCVLVSLSFALYAGKVRRWTDDSGRVHYGDTPPAAVQAERVEIIERSRGDSADIERLERMGGGDPFQVRRPAFGMPSHQLLRLWGQPQRRDYLANGMERWEYDRPGRRRSVVTLTNGQVSRITDAPNERYLYERVDQSNRAAPQAPGTPP